MKARLSLAVIATLLAGNAGVYAAELPTYEAAGLPISQVQMQLLGAANAQQTTASATSTQDGLPATPHQLAVLAHRPRLTAEALAPTR